VASGYDRIVTAACPPLARALREVSEVLERARRTGHGREIEAAIERINVVLDDARTIPHYAH
jgi:hypothetical protein